MTAVADREGDIYEMFADRPEGVEVLVRAAQDRAVPEGAGKLFSSLADRPEKEHAIELPARPTSLPDHFSQTYGIPVDDDGGEQVEPGHAVVLALARAVADFALASDPEGVLEGMMRLPLVQSELGRAAAYPGPGPSR